MLKIGDTFKQIRIQHPIYFKVLAINRHENTITVECTSYNKFSHTETWDDLDILELSFITKYKMVQMV